MSFELIFGGCTFLIYSRLKINCLNSNLFAAKIRILQIFSLIKINYAVLNFGLKLNFFSGLKLGKKLNVLISFD